MRLYKGSLAQNKKGYVACFVTAWIIILHFFAPASMFQAPINVVSESSGKAQCCVVVKNGRYLMNSGGFHIGHWGFVLPDIFAALNRMPRRPKACAVILTDNVATRLRLKRIMKAAEGSSYMRASLTMLQDMSGTLFKLSDRNTRCSALALINADALKVPTIWPNFTAFRASEDAARDVLQCNETSRDDVLIYNRRGTREIVNYEEVIEYIEKLGLKAKVLYSNQLSPDEQICEMTNERRVLITPHGGQQGSLFFKRAGVAVVIASPEAHLFEYYRFLALKSDPWYHIRGNRSWSCPGGFCSESEEAWGNDSSCGLKCERRARADSITLSLSALHDVFVGMGIVDM